MQDGQSVSPDLFWQTMTAFQHSAALKAAIDIDLFTAMDNGGETAAKIAASTGSSERGVRILCDSLTVIGFLTKNDGRYSLTPSTKTFLSRNSPQFIGSAVDFILSPAQRRGFDDFTSAVRNGGSGVTGDASLDPNSPMWVTFAKAMMPLMFPTSQMIAERVDFDTDRKLKVLDIAAGHGIFGISLAKRFPNADIYAVDWPNVLTVATENAERFGVSDRHHLIPGSAFDAEFGEGYDVVLLTNFLHHFDAETCVRLLEKIYRSMADGGRLYTLEFVPDEDRISPPREALFSIVMLAATPAGDAYTYSELQEMLATAGFTDNQIQSLDPVPQHLIISAK
jgi:ubiquinone/menaquinone biosynthesis C-methylase UbiE